MIPLEQRLQQQPNLDLLGPVRHAVHSVARHPHADERKQFLDIERLRHIVAGACRQAPLLIIGHGFRGQNDDRQLLPVRVLANLDASRSDRP